LGRDGFDYPFQIDYDLAWKRLVEAFKEVCAHHSDVRVAIVYKTKEPRNWLFMSTAAKTILLAHEVGWPNLGALIDFGHTLVSNESPAESVALLARNNRLFHTHLNDNTGSWDDDLAFGSLHFLETLEFLYWLDRVGYAGWLSFDPHPRLEDPSKMIEVNLRYTKGLIGLMRDIGEERIERAIKTREVTEIIGLLNEHLFPSY
jgi:xylose isomerase